MKILVKILVLFLVLEIGYFTYLYFNTDSLEINPEDDFEIIPTVVDSYTFDIEEDRTETEEEVDYICSNDCVDCALFPVGKKYSLRDDYRPTLYDIEIDGQKHFLEPETKEAIEKFISFIKTKGINARIASAYRSYDRQSNLFNKYVNLEIKENAELTREKAEEKANEYSARPGQSEHQLGTTLDLSCGGCVTFGDDENSKKLYDVLEEYSTQYGFVVSYSDGTETQTGITYEPWHIRYIGKDLAQEYKKLYDESGQVLTLENFLVDLTCEKPVVTE